MKEYKHAAKDKPETKPAHDQVAKAAYAISQQEVFFRHMPSKIVEAETQLQHADSDHPDQHDHHAHMVADFRTRLWISLVLTLPILVLSPMLKSWWDCAKPFGFRAKSMSCSDPQRLAPSQDTLSPQNTDHEQR